MMWNLIITEFMKLFSRKKNIITIVAFCCFICIYIFANMSFNDVLSRSQMDSNKQELQSTQEELSNLKNSSISNPGIQKLDNLIIKTENQIKLLTERQNAEMKGDWKTQLGIQLRLDKQLLSDIRQGNVISGVDTTTLSKQISVNQVLYNKNIKPINEQASMTGYNFLKLIDKDILPVLSIIMVLVLSSDIISIESDEGTFKILLTQPITRAKIIISKIITVTLFCVVTISSCLLLFFLILGITKGFGSPIYPSEYLNAHMSSFFTSNIKNSFEIIGIKSFILRVLPLYILNIIFISALGVLMSTLIQNSTTAICTSVLIAISINILENQLSFFKSFAQFIPFTYNNPVDLLNGNLMLKFGNKNITFMNGILVLIIFTLICYILSLIAFRKKDIIC